MMMIMLTIEIPTMVIVTINSGVSDRDGISDDCGDNDKGDINEVKLLEVARF